jgi:hypothetical protein
MSNTHKYWEKTKQSVKKSFPSQMHVLTPGKKKREAGISFAPLFDFWLQKVLSLSP